MQRLDDLSDVALGIDTTLRLCCSILSTNRTNGCRDYIIGGIVSSYWRTVVLRC